MIIDTGVMGSAPLKSADLTVTQPSVPDVPYEPELDIEIDFPRGTRVPPCPCTVAVAFSHVVVTVTVSRSHFTFLSPPLPFILSSLPK